MQLGSFATSTIKLAVVALLSVGISLKFPTPIMKPAFCPTILTCDTQSRVFQKSLRTTTCVALSEYSFEYTLAAESSKSNTRQHSFAKFAGALPFTAVNRCACACGFPAGSFVTRFSRRPAPVCIPKPAGSDQQVPQQV